MTFEKPRKPISSPEPAPGPTQLDLLAGLTHGPSGPAPVPASRSRKPASEPVLLMNGTCGPTFIDSSALAVQPSSLASRLAARLGMLGSTESALIWSAKATPAKRLIFRLRPWTRRTSGKGSIGPQDYMPTPTVADVQGGRKHRSGKRANEPLLNGIMTWSTPRASDGEKGGPNMSFGAGGQPLPAQMHKASAWPTPSSRDWKDTPGMDTERPDGRSRLDQLPRQMAASWTTPTLKGDYNRKGASPSAGDGVATQMRGATARSGATPSGSTATTGSVGAPNPDFAFWLQGVPDEFLNGVLRATKSASRSRSNSSKR